MSKLRIVIVSILVLLAAQAVQADDKRRDRDRNSGGRSDFGANQAAESARRQTGGRVLNVKPGDDGFRVKVLTPDGEVRYVPVDKPKR